ncbi:MAG: hypothetical protein DSY88_11160 [Candidatus Poseidoniales archaeon]|nr:MAG: hypothetical protein DSY88_11160 [Candidatus Poseidoniales archaeon]
MGDAGPSTCGREVLDEVIVEGVPFKIEVDGVVEHDRPAGIREIDREHQRSVGALRVLVGEVAMEPGPEVSSAVGQVDVVEEPSRSLHAAVDVGPDHEAEAQ